MKTVLKQLINSDEASELPEKLQFLKKNKSKVIEKILSAIKEITDFELCDESYSVIEKNPTGHRWHVDTGTNNKMPWCKLGASMLLTDDFTGGEFLYRDKNGKVEEILDRKIYDLHLHTSDEEHMVRPSVGNRTVLLIFI